MTTMEMQSVKLIMVMLYCKVSDSSINSQRCQIEGRITFNWPQSPGLLIQLPDPVLNPGGV